MVKLFYIMIEERCDLWVFNENGLGEVSKDLADLAVRVSMQMRADNFKFTTALMTNCPNVR